MYRIHRLFLRSALVYFLAGTALGIWLQVERAIDQRGHGYWMVLVHTHLLTVGFFTMMIMGVAQWMFPRRPGIPKEKAARDPLAWASWIALNAGILLRAGAEPFHPEEFTRPMLLVSAILQGLAVLCFVTSIARRIRGPWAFPEL